MGKIIGIGFLVVAIWVGMTVYTEGIDNAFDGRLARFSSGEKTAEGHTSVMERVQASGTRARDQQLSRIERQLDDTSVGLREN